MLEAPWEAEQSGGISSIVMIGRIVSTYVIPQRHYHVTGGLPLSSQAWIEDAPARGLEQSCVTYERLLGDTWLIPQHLNRPVFLVGMRYLL